MDELNLNDQASHDAIKAQEQLDLLKKMADAEAEQQPGDPEHPSEPQDEKEYKVARTRKSFTRDPNRQKSGMKKGSKMLTLAEKYEKSKQEIAKRKQTKQLETIAHYGVHVDRLRGWCMEEGMEEFKKRLMQIESNEEFAKIYLKMMEFFIPKAQPEGMQTGAITIRIETERGDNMIDLDAEEW